MRKSVIERIKDFEIKHKIISFLIVLILTIIITRIIVAIFDPNFAIKGFEIHHFYYGLVLLIIVSLMMLYRKGGFPLHLILVAMSIGLIIDEFIFILTKVRGVITYTSTFSSAIIAIIIIMLIVEFIYWKLGKNKK